MNILNMFAALIDAKESFRFALLYGNIVPNPKTLRFDLFFQEETLN
jgi:hypothetical protein